MGGSESHHQHHQQENRHKIANNYECIEQVQAAIKQQGLETSNLVFAIDCTKSNIEQGQRTFQGLSLHHLGQNFNPYQLSLLITAKVLQPFDDDKFYPMYGFGDEITRGRTVFNFAERAGQQICPLGVAHGENELLALYNAVMPRVNLSGPTSFVPCVLKFIEVVRQVGDFHIGVIIGDGAVMDPEESRKAISLAANYPLSLVMVGVGDGPWKLMEEFDDTIHQSARRDNFQFVEFFKHYVGTTDSFREASLATALLQEVPEQYQYTRKHSLIQNCFKPDRDFEMMYQQYFGFPPQYKDRVSVPRDFNNSSAPPPYTPY